MQAQVIRALVRLRLSTRQYPPLTSDESELQLAAYAEALSRYPVHAIEAGCRAWLDTEHGGNWPALAELTALVSRCDGQPALPRPAIDEPQRARRTLRNSAELRREYAHWLHELRTRPETFGGRAPGLLEIGLDRLRKAGLTEADIAQPARAA